jgi:hypothetical protein
MGGASSSGFFVQQGERQAGLLQSLPRLATSMRCSMRRAMPHARKPTSALLAALPAAGAGEAGGPAGVFSGTTTTANNGGFASVRTRNAEPPLDLGGEARPAWPLPCHAFWAAAVPCVLGCRRAMRSGLPPALAPLSCHAVLTANPPGLPPCPGHPAYEGLELRLKGDGQRYKLILRCSPGWDTVGYTASFPTQPGWQTVRLPFRDLAPVFRARTQRGMAPFNPASVYSVQLMLRWGDGGHVCVCVGWGGGQGLGGETSPLPRGMSGPYAGVSGAGGHCLALNLSTAWGVPGSSSPIPPCPVCSKFESDGALNPTFREGAFELPVERISGAGRSVLPLAHLPTPTRQPIAEFLLLRPFDVCPSHAPPDSLSGGASGAALCAGEQRGRDATQPPRHQRGGGAAGGAHERHAGGHTHLQGARWGPGGQHPWLHPWRR